MEGKRILSALWLFLALSGTLDAHDLWIEPSSFQPEVGSTLSVRIFVGQGFLGDPLPRDDRHIVRFVLAGPSGSAPLLGLPGSEPAGLVRVPGPGLHVIAYETSPSTVDLDPQKLGVHIKDEGLEPFFHADLSKPIRDDFSRCAKSLVLAGEPGTGTKGYDRRLGLMLELVPEANPYALGKDRTLPVRLLLDGKPLKDALVIVLPRGRPDQKVGVRTDARGRVLLKLPTAGVWLVKAVYIAPVPGTSGEWASIWASLTFEVPGSSPSK